MAQFVNDTFTDTNGTVLTSHTGETGATWTFVSADTNGMVIQGNRLVATAATGVDYATASGSPAGAEYDVTGVVRVVSALSADLCGVIGRFNASGSLNGYRAIYFNTDGQWSIGKWVAGSFTSLGTYSQSLSLSTDYTLKLELRNATKKVYIDGVERISTADNAITGAAFAGAVTRIAQAATGYHLDSITADDAAAAATTPHRLLMMHVGI